MRGNLCSVAIAWNFGIYRFEGFASHPLFGKCCLGAYAWEISLVTFSKGTFAWEFEMLSLGNFSFGSSAWKLSLGILALETSACAQDLLLGTFRKGTFAWDRSLGIRRLESFGWDRSLRDLRLRCLSPLRSCAWELSLWKYLLGLISWELRSKSSIRDPSLENFHLGCDLGIFVWIASLENFHFFKISNFSRFFSISKKK